MDEDIGGETLGREGTEQSQKSLADIFREKRGLPSLNSEEETRVRQPAAIPKKEKSKEELAEIRKQMMKRPSRSKASNATSSLSSDPSMSGAHQSSLDSKASSSNNPKNELMSRLARGEKVEVNKKDMLKLTNKNYEMLPEVRKKREEEKKKEEMRERMRQVKELEKQRRELMSAGSHRGNSARR